jgi:hypothetical protein
VGWADIGVLTTESLRSPDLNPVTIGYPGDKELATQWRTNGGSLSEVTETLLYTQLDVYFGQSGSAIFRGSDGAIVGVVSAGNSTTNVAVRAHALMVAEILAGCAELGCDPSYFVEEEPPPPPSSGNAFDDVWNTTDQAVASGGASYSWFWGPQVNYHTYEQYQESPGQQREVRYYDKSRMEINNPNGDRNSIYYVTNGLLTSELVTGNMQLGDSKFEQHAASTQLVAGDASNNPGTPSYAMFAQRATTDGATHRSSDRTGQEVTDFLYGNGSLSATESRGVRLANYQAATGHNIPDVFWNWATNPNSGFRPEQGVDWLYVLGYPITDPYWIDSTVGGATKRVLVQLFQRRVLTYTPSNPVQYQIEFGNIGQHYYHWRYVDSTNPPPPPPSPSPPPGSQYPTEGDVEYQPDMSSLSPFTSQDGKVRAYWDSVTSSYVVEDATPITNSSSGFYYWWESTAGAANDYSVSVDIVTLDYNTTGESEAGIYTRVESNSQEPTEMTYSGVDSSGAVWGYYLGPNDSRKLAETDASAAFHSGYGAVNQLKVIVKDSHAWVFLNNQFVHDYALDSRSSAAANGFALAMYRYGNAAPVTRFGFRNLVVREVH